MRMCEGGCGQRLRRRADEKAEHYQRRKTCGDAACIREAQRKANELRREVRGMIG